MPFIKLECPACFGAGSVKFKDGETKCLTCFGDAYVTKRVSEDENELYAAIAEVERSILAHSIQFGSSLEYIQTRVSFDEFLNNLTNLMNKGEN